MPLQLSRGLPAATQLRAEGIAVIEMSKDKGTKGNNSNSSTLQILLINLMPDKVTTETQFARLLGATPFDVSLTLSIPESYHPKSASTKHLTDHYHNWQDLKKKAFDGLVITGAPLEHLAFEDVTYWEELTEIFDWAQKNVRQSYYTCWAAQAALYHFHGIQKRMLGKKAFGVFSQELKHSRHRLFQGFGGPFDVPVSRHSDIAMQDLLSQDALQVLAGSLSTGPCLVEDSSRSMLCMFNHFEYDHDTLAREFQRDKAKGQAIALPHGYFPKDDPAQRPINRWRSFGQLLFLNWLSGLSLGKSKPDNASLATKWLFEPDKSPISQKPVRGELLVFAIDTLDLIPDLLHSLGQLGQTPRRLRVCRNGDGTALVKLELDPLSQTASERHCRALVKIPNVQRVAYRQSGKRGTVVSQFRPQLSPPPAVTVPIRRPQPLAIA